VEETRVGFCSDLSSLSEMLSLVRTSDSKHYVSFKTPTLLISRSPCGGKRHPRARALKGTVTTEKLQQQHWDLMKKQWDLKKKHWDLMKKHWDVTRNTETWWETQRPDEKHWDLMRNTEIWWETLRSDEKHWDLMRNTEIWWETLMGNTEIWWRNTKIWWRNTEIWWETLRSVEKHWDQMKKHWYLMRNPEIWWEALRSDEKHWDQMRNTEIWDLMRNTEIWWETLRADEKHWDLRKIYLSIYLSIYTHTTKNQFSYCMKKMKSTLLTVDFKLGVTVKSWEWVGLTCCNFLKGVIIIIITVLLLSLFAVNLVLSTSLRVIKKVRK